MFELRLPSWQELRHLVRRRSFLFALTLSLGLLVTNIIVQPSFVSPGNLPSDLGLFAPLALVALASTPAVMSGNGGLDISIGPIMNFISIVMALHVLPTGLGTPWLAIPIALLMGAGIGAINGTMVAVLRYQPMIATLCTFFVLGGADIALAPNPVETQSNFTNNLAGQVGPIPGAIFTIGAVFVLWGILSRLPFRRTLLAAGASDSTAYSAGVNVTLVRVLAYSLGGLIAGIAALALTGVIQSADPSFGTQYALIGMAAVALGGTPIGGGRGGLLGSLLGALAIYLIRNLLIDVDVAGAWVEVLYGGLLVGSVVFSASVLGRPQLKAA